MVVGQHGVLCEIKWRRSVALFELKLKRLVLTNDTKQLCNRLKSLNTIKLECGPMPNVMVALSNIGGAVCSTPQSLADAHY